MDDAWDHFYYTCERDKYCWGVCLTHNAWDLVGIPIHSGRGFTNTTYIQSPRYLYGHTKKTKKEDENHRRPVCMW